MRVSIDQFIGLMLALFVLVLVCLVYSVSGRLE